jgi:hypothetical protein
MIRWNRPAKLEEFLVPNEIDWSVPDWMVKSMEGDNVSVAFKQYGGAMMQACKKSRSVVLEGFLQDLFGGSSLYHSLEAELTVNKQSVNEKGGWASYENIFHDLFRSLFKPSPPVAQLVREKMSSANLTAGGYISCHHRAFYAVEDQKHKRKDHKLRSKAINAVNCASKIMPGAPIYFASDSQKSIDSVREYAKRHSRPIATIHEDTEEALHLDKVEDWENRQPADFYPTFVDLLLMANGRCTAFGEGGFGRFGALLSHNASCTIQHNKRGETDDCEWKDADEDRVSVQRH